MSGCAMAELCAGCLRSRVGALRARPARTSSRSTSSASSATPSLPNKSNRNLSNPDKNFATTANFSEVVGVELHGGGEAVLGEVGDLGEVTREPATVTVGRAELALPDLHAEAVLVTGAGAGGDAVEELWHEVG